MIIKEHSVRMDDGVSLATDVYLPDEGDSYPALLIMTPYGRKTKKIFAEMFVPRGYALVVQDVRGRYDSEGEFKPIEQEKKDGPKTIDWIIKQNWFDDNKGIGIVGISYLSTCAFPAIAKKDEIKTMINIGGFSDLYELTHRGGALVLHHALPWSIITSYSPQPDLSKIDWDEVYSTVPLKDAASKAGYPNEIWDTYCEHPERDGFWDDASVEEFLPEVDIPILHMSGWYDLCLGPTVDLFEYFSENSDQPQHLVIGPWTHNSVLRGGKVLHGVDFGDESRPGIIENILNWFDRWLKGKEAVDGFSTEEKNVSLFLIGEGRWIHDMEKSEEMDLYFSNKGLVQEIPGGEKKVEYFIEEPVPTVGGRIWEFPDAGLEPGPADQSELYDRNDVLLFTTEPLKEPFTVVGDVVCELDINTTDKGSDLCVKLVDIDEEGRARFVGDGVKRMGSSGIHRVDLWWVAHTFKEGHKIGVEIAGSNFPQWSLSPSLMEEGKDEYSINIGKENGSMLILPISDEV